MLRNEMVVDWIVILCAGVILHKPSWKYFKQSVSSAPVERSQTKPLIQIFKKEDVSKKEAFSHAKLQLSDNYEGLDFNLISVLKAQGSVFKLAQKARAVNAYVWPYLYMINLNFSKFVSLQLYCLPPPLSSQCSTQLYSQMNYYVSHIGARNTN